ncbi:RNA binding protein snu13 [Thelotrema lepadinum]|nr:RNA binding protein snu13 [Thelotrema lepadinum]
MAQEQNAAWPLADQALSQEILDIVQQAMHSGQLKKGANEGEVTDVPYVFVPSKVALARSAGMGRAAIAVSITSNPESDLNGQIQGLKDKVERLMI